MNENKKVSLEDLLSKPNHELLSTHSKFADVIWKYESIAWNEAQKKASTLLKANEASNYLNDVRTHLQIHQNQLSEQRPEQTVLVAKESFVEPTLKRTDEITNYGLLMQLAPELEKQLWDFNEDGIVGGVSAKNIYGSAELTYLEKDRKGFYLRLTIDGQTPSWIKIKMYVDINEQELLVLNYENADGETKVYDDDFNREMVNLYEQETQSKFVNDKLKKLIRYKLFILPKRVISVTPKVEVPDKPKEDEKAITTRNAFNQPSLIRQAVQNAFSQKREYYQKVEEHKENDKEISLLQTQKEQNEWASLDHLAYQNFLLLKQLVPTLNDEFKLATFELNIGDGYPEHPRYRITASMDNESEYREHCFEMYKKENENEAEEFIGVFVTKKDDRVLFLLNEAEFFGLYDEYQLFPTLTPKRFFEDYFKCNVALNKFFHFCLINNFKTQVTNRIYRAVDETETAELTVAEESDSGGGEGFAILGVVGLGILGVLGIRKLL
jgi:hypothetical protein